MDAKEQIEKLVAPDTTISGWMYIGDVNKRAKQS